MEHLIYYYGACLMGLLSLVSMLAVYNSNKRVLGDLQRPAETRDKWLGSFVQEHQKLLKENTEIHNPSVYVIKRMRGRKIGPCSMRQVKGISWGTFILSFLFIGIQALYLLQKGIENIRVPFTGSTLPAMNLTIITGISMGIILLAVRLLMGTGYQEEEIETELLDYVENKWKEPAKIIPMENPRSFSGKETKSGRKKEPAAQEAKEKALRQMEQGILEAAATDSRYSHLLNKEEEAIVKDVVKEFLT